jgi:hypothetical protein
LGGTLLKEKSTQGIIPFFVNGTGIGKIKIRFHTLGLFKYMIKIYKIFKSCKKNTIFFTKSIKKAVTTFSSDHLSCFNISKKC